VEHLGERLLQLREAVLIGVAFWNQVR
jgi:hypothetical protein